MQLARRQAQGKRYGLSLYSQVTDVPNPLFRNPSLAGMVELSAPVIPRLRVCALMAS